MEELSELIRHENESTRVDFKRTQYTKPNYEELLKDILAMANANVKGDRHIVIGVEHRSDGTRDFIGVREDEFVDSATYHQLVRENIEPEIHFEYQPYRLEGVLLGVFRIHDCDDPPYMMRKKYGSGLNSGDAYIRKGSHKAPVTRPDLDRMLASRRDAGFAGELKLGFEAPGTPTEIRLPSIGAVKLPSERAAERIRGILEERAQAARHPAFSDLGRLALSAGALPAAFGPVPYERRSDEQLQSDLRQVSETYERDDRYAVYEQWARKINLTIVNEGDGYIEDVILRVRISKQSGLRVADRIHYAPEANDFMAHIRPPRLDHLDYPNVEEFSDCYEVTTSVENLRNGLPVRAFGEPLRVTLGNALSGKRVELLCQVFGKQLRSPRSATLSIVVMASDS